MPESDVDERSSLLDAFGAANDAPTQTGSGVTASALLPTQRIGAQKLEIKRDERQILQKMKALAAAAGEDWFYRWPVKNKKTGKTDWVEGPSIKLANELARHYGNCEVDVRVMDLGDTWLMYARFTDYETGFSMTRPFQQRKGQRTMGEDAERQRDIALQIGCSKAIRNVICNALQTLADFSFEEAKGSLVGKIGQSLAKWRENIVKRLEGKVDLLRVEAVMGRPAKEWLAPDIAQVVATMRSIADGMATIDESYPPIKPIEDSAAATLDKIGKDELSGAAPPDDAAGGGS
jgi:hypothetical protein